MSQSIESAATKQSSDRDPSVTRDLRKSVSIINAPTTRQCLRANKVTQTIFSDAILAILRTPASKVNGLITLDEDFLREYHGVTDFSKYSVVPGVEPRRIMPAKFPVLEVAEQDDEGRRVDSTVIRKEDANQSKL